MPGIVDAHVHFNDPGRADWEGWARGSRAAAAGGTTTVIDMPLNSVPPVLDGPSFDAKRAAGELASVVDVAVWGGFGRAVPVAVGAARREGTDVTVETCPHYLVFDEADVARAGPPLKCAPPIRDQANGDGLWRAVSDGRIDLVASDHSPCAPELKARGAGDVFAAWGGVAGAQSLLCALFTEATRRAAGTLDARKIAGFVAWRLATKPAKRFGLWPRKGALVPGADADVVLFDPAREWTLDAEDSLTGGISPYVGRLFRGAVVRTLVRGRTVFREGSVTREAGGRFVPRMEEGARG